jgi:hypothetical protein|tara:strand:+ start:12121 stop:13323 length:1203 start_codon:yes stop_codon:yes gene_type:complete
MKKRRLDDWLEAYIHFNRNSEAPLSYHVWGGVSAIAAVLERKCFMYWHPYRIYPNNYIVLVGPSGQSRKGDAISTARQMLTGMNIHLIGEDNTQEAIIREMADEESRLIYKDPSSGNMVMHSSVSCLSEELAVFTGQRNTTFLAYLTNWYDSRDLWTRKTKHQGTDEVIGMYFNFICSTAPDWLPGILTQESIGGGFTSRCIFVVEKGKRQTITNPNLKRPSEKERQDLRHDLEIMQTIIGEFKFSEKALARYEDWYQASDDLIAREGNPIGPMFNGYWSRRPTHIKKIAMILSASRNSSKVVELSDFDRALDILERTEVAMPQVFSGVGRSRYAEDIDAIIDFIRDQETVSKQKLLSAFYRNVDDVSLDAIINILVEMKIVKVKRSPLKNETWYEAISK